MKQSKKITWNQREALQKLGVKTENYRLLEETPTSYKLISKDGSILVVDKDKRS